MENCSFQKVDSTGKTIQVDRTQVLLTETLTGY